MTAEYLLLNGLILIGPLALSFDRRVHFVQYWSRLFPAMILMMIPFIIWDSLVTGRHWWFNTSYTLPYRIFNLPVEEWLFFITVPYACIFTWEVLVEYFSNKEWPSLRLLPIILFTVTVPLALLALIYGKEYTAIVFFAFGFVFFLDYLLKTGLFIQRRTYVFLALLTLMMLVFNGYLTARPVVLYDARYQLDFRVITIPLEDFFYGHTLILGVLIIYEKLKGRRHG